MANPLAGFFSGGNNQNKISSDNGSTQNGNSGNNQQVQPGDQNQNVEEDSMSFMKDLGFDLDADNLDLEIPDDMLNPPKEDDDDDTGTGGGDDATSLQESMKEMFTGFKVGLDDIPTDIDFTDRQQVANFMNSRQQATIQNAVKLMALPVQHAIRSLEQRISSQLETATKRGKAEQTATQVFAPIHESLKAHNNPSLLPLAKRTFQTALSTTKDSRKAFDATKRFIESISDVKIGSRSNGNRTGTGNNAGVKEGADALDELFGPYTK